MRPHGEAVRVFDQSADISIIYLKKFHTTNQLTFCLAFAKESVVYYQIYHLPQQTLQNSILLRYDELDCIPHKSFPTPPTEKAVNPKCLINWGWNFLGLIYCLYSTISSSLSRILYVSFEKMLSPSASSPQPANSSFTNIDTNISQARTTAGRFIRGSRRLRSTTQTPAPSLPALPQALATPPDYGRRRSLHPSRQACKDCCITRPMGIQGYRWGTAAWRCVDCSRTTSM